MAHRTLLLGAVVLFGLAGSRADDPPKQPPALEFKGHLTPVRRIQVTSKTPGQVVEVLVKEGQRVQLGQVLVRLDRARQETDVRHARAQLQASEARLAQVRAGARPVDLKRAEAELQEAQALAQTSEASARRAKRLALTGNITATELENVENAQRNAQLRLKTRAAVVAALKALPSADQFKVVQAEVVVARAELDGARLRLSNAEVRAPFAGTVLKLNVDVGAFTNPEAFGLASSASVCELADLTALEVEVNIPERNLVRFFKGQKGEVRLDAFPDVSYRGIIDRLSPTVDRGQGTFTLWLTLELPKKEHNLPIDACATVRFVPR